MWHTTADQTELGLAGAELSVLRLLRPLLTQGGLFCVMPLNTLAVATATNPIYVVCSA